MKIAFDVKQLLDEFPLRKGVKELSEKISKKIGERYCQVCFYGIVKGQLMGFYVCEDCASEIFNFACEDNKFREEKISNAELVSRMIMRHRFAFEDLRMKYEKEFEDEEK